MNKKILIIIFLLVIFCNIQLVSAITLDIGNEINFEYRFEERKGAVIPSEFRQRIKFYLTGYLKDNIEVGIKLHSAGILNSTATFVIFENAKIPNLIPYFESAYIRINELHDLPLSLSIGKLSLSWLDGILLNDNQKGFPAILIEATAPHEIFVEAYHLWTRNELLGISQIKGHGVRIFRNFGVNKVSLNYTFEEYESSAKVRRTIYGGSFIRNMYRGIEYSLFGYLMRGEKGGVGFSGHAFGAYGRFEGVVEPFGRGGAWIRYIVGSGDPNDDERGFLPILSSVESEFIGYFYGQNREFRMKDGEISDITLSNSIANLSVMRTGLYAKVLDKIDVYMIRSTFSGHYPSFPLGGSITFGASYEYNSVKFNITHTIFDPEPEYDGYISDENTRLITAEVSARF